MADIDISSVSQAVAVSEAVTVSFEFRFVNVEQAVAVTETVTVRRENFISVTDSVAVAEFVSLSPKPDVTDSVSVLEAVTVIQHNILKQHEAMIMPVWELSGSFAQAFTLESSSLKIPGRSILGTFGASLSEREIPLRTVSASMAANDVGLSGGANKAPTWSCTGQFGSRLSERIPPRSLEASFNLAGILSLDAIIPVRRLSASFKYPSSFTLNRQIPIWIGEGSLVLSSLGASLASKIPGAFVFSGSMHEVGGFRLAQNIPVRRLESSMFTGGMYLDADIPVWIMGGRIGDSTGGVISYHSRFTDYILRYIRP